MAVECCANQLHFQTPVPLSELSLYLVVPGGLEIRMNGPIKRITIGERQKSISEITSEEGQKSLPNLFMEGKSTEMMF